jgi:ribosomal protein L40E
MAVFEEAEARLYKNVYVCRKCKRKSRFPIGKILAGKGVCLRCSSKHLRPVRKISKK